MTSINQINKSIVCGALLFFGGHCLPGVSDAERVQSGEINPLVSGVVEIEDLTVRDEAYASGWSVQSNLQSGARVFSDREVTIKTVPAAFKGATWIQTPDAAKASKAKELLEFVVAEDADVYVGIDEGAWEKTPWMKDWIDSSYNITAENEEGEPLTYNMHRFKTRPGFAAGATVSLGPTAPSAPTNYIIVVLPGVEERVGWEIVPEILAKINPPTFPDRTFNIMDYGAVADNETLNTEAFAKAIAACSAAGGGTVLVPEGTFMTGAIHFKSNVNLRVEGNINFSRDPKDYLPVVLRTFEGSWVYDYSPFIYAIGVENIALTGSGIIDGRADEENWWDWKWIKDEKKRHPGDFALRTFNKDRVPIEERVLGEGYYLRPQLLQFIDSKNILVQGVTLKNSPFWVTLYTRCENVTIDDIEVYSNYANGDGANPEGTRYMHIKDSYFTTGDDGFALKAGRNHDGRSTMGPTEYIVIQNCVYQTKDDARFRGNCLMAMGSEMSGGINQVYVEDCTVIGNLAGKVFNRKTSPARGGYIMNIYTRNIDWSQVTGKRHFYRAPTGYPGLEWKRGDPKLWPPVFHNINVKE